MKFTRCGLDIAKQVFQVHGVNEHGVMKGRRRLPRARVLEFFAQLPPCLIGIEACGSAHYWGRELTKLGHTVKLMAAPQTRVIGMWPGSAATRPSQHPSAA